MNYAVRLNQTKDNFPFEEWKKLFDDGLDQYSEENCDRMRKVFDGLIGELAAKGESASEEEKIEAFKVAVEATNELDEETGMIETGEREELCKLFNSITIACGLNPKDYGDGEGLASEWREW